MKRTLPAIALIAGLSLTGCSGGGQSHDDAGAEPAQAGAEQAPAVTKLDEATLKDIVESTDVDGQTFKAIDANADSGSEALKALENAEFTPSECKDLTMAALNASQASGGTTVSGISTDNTLSVGLLSLEDVSAAESQVKNSTKVTEDCSDVTISSQGIEMTMSFEPFDASVAGADETIGVRASIGAGGQTVLNTSSITARAGNNVVTAANVVDVDEAVVSKTAETFVAAVKNAG